MATALEYEQKTGVMVRGITADVKKRYSGVIKNLYNPEYKGPGDYAKSAEDWHNILSDLCVETDGSLSDYLATIEMAFKIKHDLWQDDEWKTLMRVDLPIQFRKRMDTFTLVPKLAAMDEPQEKEVVQEEEW